MMGTIMPFMYYITLQGVDHEDAILMSEEPPPDFILQMIGAKETDFVVTQGIGAGVIINAGPMVESHLKPGYKVYYDTRYARRIGDIWVVDTRAVMAYEEF